MEISTEYITAGGNRHSSAADWSPENGLLAFGSDRNVALCQPLDSDDVGIRAILSGHSGSVNVIRFFPNQLDKSTVILSGSVDQKIRVWRGATEPAFSFQTAAVLNGHTASVNCLAVVNGGNIFASGAADTTIKIWCLLVKSDGVSSELLQNIQISPRFFPLALTLSPIGQSGALILATGGTKSVIQTYVSNRDQKDANFVHKATLAGHEGWIRSLDFVNEGLDKDTDLLLASASQDKYIRLWRVHRCDDLTATMKSTLDASLGKLLSIKAHRLEAAGSKYTLTFEALLLGHEDWIYTALWKRNGNKLQLLSASADNSLAVWEPDTGSGVWICSTRLGEISAQKGSTTATGSTGGFWMGLWSPKGNAVASLGGTGSWRVWKHGRDEDRWTQALGTSGHVKAVTGITWAKDGSYLLSTSSDQTTRLHAEWTRGENRSWHEFSRPQIHGYDLNCIDSFGKSQYISGADEKLLRVFNEPRAIASLLEKLCGIGQTGKKMPDAANMPVLGLSNKAVDMIEDDDEGLEGLDEHEAADPASIARRSTLDIDHPPLEDHLARHTLWPEREKLYGHGYEISAVVVSHDGALVATSCKASSLDHAVVRLYETREWREIRPSLSAHSLTVTCLRFSNDDMLLLSVGRDRQWTVFERDSANGQTYATKASNPKGHSRMILGAAWAPSKVGRVFATAGRDKSVKLWAFQEKGFKCKITIPATSAVTTVSFSADTQGNATVLAVGTESGEVTLLAIDMTDFAILKTYSIDRSLCPALSVTQVSWRPSFAVQILRDSQKQQKANTASLLAVASEDSSLRILSIDLAKWL